MIVRAGSNVSYWHAAEVDSSKFTAAKQTLTTDEIKLPVCGSLGREAVISNDLIDWQAMGKTETGKVFVQRNKQLYLVILPGHHQQ